MNEKQLFKLCFSAALGASLLNAGNVVASPKATALQQAAERQVKGVVLDENGDPVIGATVAVKGQKAAAVTDIDGKFSIKVPTGSTLVVTYLGYEPKEVKAQGDNLTVKLSQSAQNINEVVVTALGIKKEAKSLSYNVQQLGADAVTKVQDANFVNSLNGKVAGVQFSQSSAGAGSATRVVMRGVKSINGNNGALYVIDGVPMPNLRASSSEATMYGGSGSTGDSAADINPSDIESISVLSGPSAAALYGSDASNGVILITTKKGQAGRLDVTYSGSFQFSRPFVTHKFQNTYGPTSTESFDSWGSKLSTPSEYDPNDFFQTGTNFSNNVSISTGTDKNQTYMSLGANNSTGLIHNNNFDRYNLNFRNTAKFCDDKMTLDFNYTLSNIREQNMITQGQYHNPLYTLYLFPAGGDWQGIQYYNRQDLSRNLETQYWPWLDQGDLMENPYWIAEKEKFVNHKMRNMVTAMLKWDVTKWLSLTGRVKYDNSNNRYEQKFNAGTKLQFASDAGYYGLRNQNASQYYAEAFATVNKYWNENEWSLTGVLGTNYDRRDTKEESASGNLATVPNKFTLNNLDPSDPKFRLSQKYSERRIKQAIYGSAQLGYKSLAYLDLTARNDWSSALAPYNKSYFYWSGGISGIWTDIFPVIKTGGWLNYFKTRISYSEVGNDPSDPYLTTTTYGISASGPNLTTSKKNPNLKAELTKSWEAGLDFVLFQNKLKINATLYKSRTYNQFFNIQLDPSSGYTNMWVNGGTVDNKGVELSARFNQPLGPVQWETYLTWTLNRNEVKEVSAEYTDPETGEKYSMKDAMNLGGFNGTRNTIVKGGNLTDIYVRTLATGEHGEIIVDPQDKSIKVDANRYVNAGHSTPNYNLSWGNSFSWKGFNLGFLFNYRQGGIVVSLTESLMDAYGSSKTSADARDAGGVVINGIGGYNPQAYYQTVASTTQTIASQYVYSATNLRLQELSFGYDIPITKYVKWIKGLNLSFVAHNLWMIYCKAPFDPELTAYSGTYNQGIDFFMQPSSRSMGFSAKVKF